MHRSFYHYIVAAATTAIAGILHLIWASSIIGKAPPAISIFFIVSGLAQVFWALPMIKRWSRKWYYIGLAGTVILVILYAATRVPNPLTGGRPDFDIDIRNCIRSHNSNNISQRKKNEKGQ
jgi:hypothetical protein